MYQPLADILRPTSLDEVYGQEHILGPGGLLRRIIESGAVPNMIFYGPSGVGKTTVANIIAKKTQRKLCRLNATTASSSDIKEIVSQLDTFLAPNGILLYLDEIQYFTKKQQQTLLEHIERGAITLIASTTENPYFYIYNAVLSRSTVFEFKPVSPAGAEKAIRRAIAYEADKTGLAADIPDDVIAQMAKSCGGDLRKAINAVELLFSAAAAQDGKITITMDDALAVSQKSSMRYDRGGRSALRRGVGADEVPPGLRSRRGAALPGQAFGGRGSLRRLPPDPLLCQRGHRHGLSPGHFHREGLRGQRLTAGASRGAPSPG